VQGANSKELMFEANFCQKCNNERSQQFDRAYDKFINYVHYNSSIIATKQLKFSSIFQADWQQQRENVIKYYVKHICCRLAESNIFIDPKIIAYLNGDTHISCIEMDFHIREDIVAMEKYLVAEKFPEGSVWIGAGIADYHQLTNTYSLFRSHIGYRWLWIYYRFDDTLLGEFNENPNDLLIFESGYLIDPLIFEKT
jgi:hypothetical protein